MNMAMKTSAGRRDRHRRASPSAAPAMAADDPGPAAYAASACKGKRVALVPMAMGFDLAQGWAAYLKTRSRGLGRHLRDARSELERRGRRAGDHRPDQCRSAAGRAGRPLRRTSTPTPSCSRRRRQKGIYVILIDNPANFPADAFIGCDWDRLGQLEAEAAVKGCGEGSSKKIGLVQGDQVNASSLYQYAGIMKVLDKHPDFKVVAKPDSELGCDDGAQRHHDDAAAEPRHLRHHRFLGR